MNLQKIQIRRVSFLSALIICLLLLIFIILGYLKELAALKTNLSNQTQFTSSVEVNDNTPPGYEILNNPTVGYSLHYPKDWKVKAAIAASDFQKEASCQSVEVVDSNSELNRLQSASYLHSLVQICTKSLTDNLTLDQFLQETYKDGLQKLFTKTLFNGSLAYMSEKTDPYQVIIFLQTKKYRIQILGFVSAKEDQRLVRNAQIQEILDSFSLE